MAEAENVVLTHEMTSDIWCQHRQHNRGHFNAEHSLATWFMTCVSSAHVYVMH